AVKGRSKESVGAFFAALGEQRSACLRFVTCDGAEWIRTVVAAKAPEAIVCLDTFHVVSVRREAPCIRRRVRDPPHLAVAAAR
ncbi:MAG: transposase, partial [Actinomycetes bacterium]